MGVFHVLRVQDPDSARPGWADGFICSWGSVMGVGPDIDALTSPISEAAPCTAIAFFLMRLHAMTEEGVRGVRAGGKLLPTAPHHADHRWSHCYMERIPMSSILFGRCKVARHTDHGSTACLPANEGFLPARGGANAPLRGRNTIRPRVRVQHVARASPGLASLPFGLGIH